MSDEKLDRILSLLEEIRAGLGAPPSVWLTPAEAAAYLGVSITRIYQYIRGDAIPHHRLPDSNLVRLHAKEVDDWVRRGEQSKEEVAEDTLRRISK